MNELINNFNNYFNLYNLNRNAYNALVIDPNPIIQDSGPIRIGPNAPNPNNINDSLTNAITNHFLKNNETVLEIINLYVQIYEHAITRYVANNIYGLTQHDISKF